MNFVLKTYKTAMDGLLYNIALSTHRCMHKHNIKCTDLNKTTAVRSTSRVTRMNAVLGCEIIKAYKL